ncbi:MAG: hypothetical protein IKY17_07855 [Oscillospiraceae bacterium]|nr:hypothetical protein [Oscillospiraceae bacterium]
MAGPGGGGNSGGGGRGGFSGGGFSSGGFGGGHVPMGGGWHRRRGFVGGGCCSGFFGTIIFVVAALFLMIGSFFGKVDINIDRYDEEKFQDFANSQYEAEFGRSSAYEDNLLITVLTQDDYTSFYYIAWVGDHVDQQINALLGNNSTALGRLMESNISQTNYKYSMDADLARVMQGLTAEIQSLGLEDSFTCSENHAQVKSHLTNRSQLDLTESTVNAALTEFTDATGIPVVVVVEDMDDVFGSSSPKWQNAGVKYSGVILAVIGVIALGVVALVVVSIRRKNQQLG